MTPTTLTAIIDATVVNGLAQARFDPGFHPINDTVTVSYSATLMTLQIWKLAIFFLFYIDDCCVNVDVSELLEHWLGWDQPDDKPATSPMPKSWADRLVSHLIGDQTLPTDDYNTNSEDPSIWVRKFCSEVGCDVLKKQDSSNGKTLLHHLLSGKNRNFGIYVVKIALIVFNINFSKNG
jgi:hypothetical protein